MDKVACNLKARFVVKIGVPLPGRVGKGTISSSAARSRSAHIGAARNSAAPGFLLRQRCFKYWSKQFRLSSQRLFWYACDQGVLTMELGNDLLQSGLHMVKGCPVDQQIAMSDDQALLQKIGKRSNDAIGGSPGFGDQLSNRCSLIAPPANSAQEL